MANINYLEKDDYTISISITNLDDIVAQGIESSGLDEETLLSNAELTAQAEITAYLSKIYDIGAEFDIDFPPEPDPDPDPEDEPVVDTRNKLIIRCTVNLSLFNLHMTINPRDVPEKVEKAYEHCLEMLKMAQQGQFDFGLTPLPEDEGAVAWRTIGSNRKFISKPYGDAQIISP